MDINNVLRGKFLTMGKLEAILSANDLSVGALLKGAKDSLEDMLESKTKHHNEYERLADMAHDELETVHLIEAEADKLQKAIGALE